MKLVNNKEIKSLSLISPGRQSCIKSETRKVVEGLSVGEGAVLEKDMDYKTIASIYALTADVKKSTGNCYQTRQLEGKTSVLILRIK